MTYRQLATEIEKLNEAQKSMDVTVCGNDDEYYPVATFGIAVDDDVLNKDHPVLVVG